MKKKTKESIKKAILDLFDVKDFIRQLFFFMFFMIITTICFYGIGTNKEGWDSFQMYVWASITMGYILLMFYYLLGWCEKFFILPALLVFIGIFKQIPIITNIGCILLIIFILIYVLLMVKGIKNDSIKKRNKTSKKSRNKKTIKK